MKDNIEKSLKRFLKRKVSYSLSLLVAFMISGEILSAEDLTLKQLEGTRNQILTKIRAEKIKIKRKIAVNNKKIDQYNKEMYDLVNKADFYAKPALPSTQIFFSWHLEESGKGKDRTSHEFAETIDAVRDYYGEMSPVKMPDGSTVMMSAEDRVRSGNGVVLDDKKFQESIDLGVNIKLATPSMPAISPSVSVAVTTPTVTLGTVKTPGAPSIPTPSITAPTAPTTGLTTPTIPTPPSAVGAPASVSVDPVGFEPKKIETPLPPAKPTIIVPTIPTFATEVASNGNGTYNYADLSTGSNGVIEMVAVRSGEFNVERIGASQWKYDYSNYSGINAWAVGSAQKDNSSLTLTGSPETWSNVSRTSTTSSGSQLGFEKLVGDYSQSTMLSNGDFLYTRKEENPSTKLGEFVHLDIHGAAPVTSQRAGLVTATNGLSNAQDILDAYDDAGDNINFGTNTTASSNRYTWINSGNITIEGGNTSLTNHYDHNHITSNKSLAINTGTVTFQPFTDGTNTYEKYTSAFVMSLDGEDVHHVMYNGATGTINTYTQTASLFLSNSYNDGRPLSIVNRGTLAMYGENSAGIYLKTGSNTDLVFKDQAGTNFKPIELYGDKSMGLYVESPNAQVKGSLAVSIGTSGKGNQTFTTTKTAGTALTNYDVNPNDSGNEDIQGTFGIVSNSDIHLTEHEIKIADKTDGNVGVYPKDEVTLGLGTGKIELDGGKNNIGILVDGKGDVNSSGSIEMLNGEKNIGIVAKGPGHSVAVDAINATNVKDAIAIYAESGSAVSTGKLDITGGTVGSGTVADNKTTAGVYADGSGTFVIVHGNGVIDITGSAYTDRPTQFSGFGLMATNGAQVSATGGQTIKIKDGSTGVASFGSGSRVDFMNGKIDYSGSGYAVYSDGQGIVDLSGTTIDLTGTAAGTPTAFDIDMTPGATQPITVSGSTHINVHTDGTIVFNLKNAPSTLSTTNLESTITGALGTASSMVSGDPGVDYKLAAVTSGNLTVGDLDKSGTGAPGETQAQKDGYFYYQRFLAQNVMATANGVTIKAEISATGAPFGGKVVGFEMNGSKDSTSNVSSGFELTNNSHLIADNTDTSGNGAIGAFVNYGKLAVDNTSDVKVETGANPNEKGIGLYATNGTEVTNAGTITVNGDKGIGIYGTAYREDSAGNVVVNEFGGITGEGTLKITNSKTIDVSQGDGTVGIYARNNNASGNNTDVTVSNTGTINIGKTAGNDTAVGIYIDKGTVSNIGTINAKEGAVGIYATNGTDITAGTGTINIADNGVGVALDGSGNSISGTLTVADNGTSGVSSSGSKTAILVTGGTPTTLNVNLNTTGLTNGVLVFADNTDVTNNGTLTPGSNGIGMYISSAGKTIKNTGTITLAAAASGEIGMAAMDGTAENANIINVNGNVGIYAGGTGNSVAKNSGTLNVTKDGIGVFIEGTKKFDGTGGTIDVNGGTGAAAGIFLKDAGTGVVQSLGTVDLHSGNDIAVYGQNSKIDFDIDTSGENTGIALVAAGGTGTTNISKKVKVGQNSIGVYVKDNKVDFTGSTIEILKPTGSSPTGSTGIYVDKTVGTTATPYKLSGMTVNADNEIGIYLQGDTTGSTGAVVDFDGTVSTTTGAGIYVSKGSILSTSGNGVINVDGGTGIFLEDGTTAKVSSGTLTFNFGANSGVGIYNKGGNATISGGATLKVTGEGALSATEDGNMTVNTNIAVSNDAVGLYGIYSTATTSSKTLENQGTITATTGGIAIGAVQNSSTSSPTGTVIASNTGVINVSGESTATPATPSTGIYTDVAEVSNTGTINVGDKAMGIFVNASGHGVTNNNVTLTGTDGTGVYLKGNVTGLTSNNITSTTAGNTGSVLDGITATSINAGTISLGDESVGVLATNNTSTTLDGNVAVGNSSATKSGVGVVVNGGSNVTVASTAQITAGDKGIGIYADGASTHLIVNNIGKVAVGTEGTYLYSKNSNVTFSGNLVADNQIGIVTEGGTVSTSGTSTITSKNGGIGMYVKGSAPTLTGVTFDVQTGTSAKHSIGVYYEGITGITTAMLPTINQNGDYTIGTVLDNSTGTMGAINVPTTGKDQIGIMAKNNSTLTTGTVSVAGDRNIGVFGENSDITTADVTVGNSSYTANKSDSSIGVYVNGGKYTGSGNLSVGDNSLGIYGENLTGGNGITFTGNTLTVGNNAVGVYGSGNGGSVNVTSTSGITVGDSNAIGVYAKGMDANVTGDINIGTDTSVGIAQEGNGNINYTGNMNIANKVNSGSIGIYKVDGAGTVTTSGVWNIGNNGYGIYAKDTTGSGITVNNSADMTLGTSGIGIYSSGNNSVSNSGTITVGDTDLGPGASHTDTTNHINSVGMYLENGSSGENTGTINITKDHSVGVFGTGAGTTFSNFGTINVDGGATGIHVRENAVAVNETSGVINLGTTLASCGTDSIGMIAYKGAKIENKGYIKVGEGIGMYVADMATLSNTGTIDITNGTGIYGNGTILNTGTIIGGGTHISRPVAVADVGAVKIDSNGNITINGSYVSVGGTLETQSHLTVNGAYVDVTTEVPVFKAPSVSGDVNILPNFASTGNGLTWEVKNFVNTVASSATSGTLTPHVSPLFVSKLTNSGSLMIAKRPYSDITLGKQFDELYDGLDKLLEKSGGKGTDAEMLMGMNEHLAGIKDEEQFRAEAGKMLGETRGDIYSTIQKRMQNVDKAFDTAFDELESSYNFTRDSDKYSIIYNKGDYKDATMGIEGYDYDTIGLLYMKEKDGNKLHTKHGYTLGFAGSKFKFDEGSKEEIYSLRAGAHNVTVLSPEHKVSLLTRGELAYNRHQTERKIHLDQTYTNKASYNTYGVSFDNKLIKNLYQDFENKLDIYAEMNTEYGKVGEFSEKSGGLKLKVKDNDYFSAKAGAGVKASRRIYLGKLWSTKLTADAKYTYELGENYDGNKTKLKDGDNGYIKLITPEKEKGRVIGKAGITFEKANNMGVTFEVEGSKADSSEKPSVKYGVRFNYKFFND